VAAPKHELVRRLEALQKIKASGISSAQHGEDRIQYRTMSELDAAIKDLEQQIAQLNSTGRRYRRMVFHGKSGW
jgi:hypothetical protein